LTEFAEQSGVKYVNDITAQIITRHIAWVVQNSPTHSAKTANNKFVQILAFLKHFGAVPTVGSGKSSRLLGMKDAPRCVEKEVKIYTEEQLTKFFFACDARETAIFQTFRRAGLREQEVATLRRRDCLLDGSAPCLRIVERSEYDYVPKWYAIRDVNIDPQLASILKAWLKTHDHALVFSTPRGKVDGHILRLCQQIARRVGLNPDDFWLHRFRSSYATHLLRYGPAIGLTLEDIRKQLGHRDVESLRRYIKALEGEERGKKVAQVFADIQVTAPAWQTAVV
jgi:integrase